MLKINIDVLICKKANAGAGSMRFQISRNFEKMRISKRISGIFEFFEIFRKERYDKCGMEGHSTSPPCGNLVDGLPHDCHTETVAKPGRLGPAQNGKLPPQNDRVDQVLLDDLQENPQKTLSSVC